MAARFEPRVSARLSRKLKALTPAAEAGIVAALDSAGARIVRSAKRRAPVDTGALRNSLAHEVDRPALTVTAGSDLHYARFVEFGTQAGLTGGQTATGRTIQRNHAGTAAQPFLFPAYKSSKRRNLKEIGLAVKAATGKVSRGV